jgi:hypothetical protein
MKTFRLLCVGLFLLLALLATALAPGLSGCGSGDSGDSPGRGTPIVLLGPEHPGSGTRLAIEHCARLLAESGANDLRRVPAGEPPAVPPGALILALGPTVITNVAVSQAEIDSLPPEGYLLARGTFDGAEVLAAVGPDDLGTQYAIYALLEVLGFGFFHPEETFVPESLSIPDELHVAQAPSYPWRGMHVHTMHPIELMDSLLVPSPEHAAEAIRYIDWLVANRQNYVQWALQDTVDIEEWIPYATSIIDYAHSRGIRVGIDTPFQFAQQNAFVLVPRPGPWEDQIAENLALLLQAPFDVVNVELGASEFIPVDDIQTLEMLDFTADHLEGTYGCELICKIHCSSGQTAPHFGGINFNFLPGLANARVGVMPHTVQFYDLWRRAPTYDNQDFSFMREFLLEQIPRRTVLYYPETSYWVSFDIDVPLFLPHYLFSRWNDLNRLQGTGMQGQITFSSGLEWGYWLNDWATAGFTYEASTDWREYLGKFTRIFGNGAGPVHELLVDIVEEQGLDLLEDNLIAFLIGWDTADDIGHVVLTHAQPVRPLFREIRRMDAEALSSFSDRTLPRLERLEATYSDFVRRLEALAPLVPPGASRWYDEIRRALGVTALRVAHVRRLYEGTVAQRRYELGLDSQGAAEASRLFEEALSCRERAQAFIAEQERSYRWPLERIARRRENPTSYEFGYLFTVSDAYYWRREELQARDGLTCLCLGNLTNLLDNLFGEGPLGEFLESLPRLPDPCLDQCVHPVDRISYLFK